MVALGWRQWRTRVTALNPTRNRSWPMGTRPSDAMRNSKSLPARPVAVGANCGVGPAQMLDSVLGLVQGAEPGDIIVAEPHALIGFAGPRVIEQTIGQRLPDDFQTAEYLLEHGFIDRIVARKDLKSEIARAIDYCGG